MLSVKYLYCLFVDLDALFKLFDMNAETDR